jgi:hypothetical protein
MEPDPTYDDIHFDEIPPPENSYVNIPLDDNNTVNPVDTTDLLGRNKKFVDAIMTIIRTKNSVDYPPNGPSMEEQLNYQKYKLTALIDAILEERNPATNAPINFGTLNLIPTDKTIPRMVYNLMTRKDIPSENRFPNFNAKNAQTGSYLFQHLTEMMQQQSNREALLRQNPIFFRSVLAAIAATNMADYPPAGPMYKPNKTALVTAQDSKIREILSLVKGMIQHMTIVSDTRTRTRRFMDWGKSVGNSIGTKAIELGSTVKTDLGRIGSNIYNSTRKRMGYGQGGKRRHKKSMKKSMKKTVKRRKARKTRK